MHLYLLSSEEKACWDKLAEDAGVPLSKFVIEIVENALAEGEDFKPRRRCPWASDSADTRNPRARIL